jgi:hypothetical protein
MNKVILKLWISNRWYQTALWRHPDSSSEHCMPSTRFVNWDAYSFLRFSSLSFKGATCQEPLLSIHVFCVISLLFSPVWAARCSNNSIKVLGRHKSKETAEFTVSQFFLGSGTSLGAFHRRFKFLLTSNQEVPHQNPTVQLANYFLSVYLRMLPVSEIA